MAAEPQDAQDRWATATVKLAGPHWELEARISVPVGPTTVARLLPSLRGLTNAMVEATAHGAQELGRSISCRAGCGACCSQLVPVAAAEARAIRDVVAAMPPARQAVIRERFAEAERRFRAAGIAEKLLDTARLEAGEAVPFGIDYFELGVPCPFLEDQSCSIYEDRPLICREYLVTSPAENCARVRTAPVERVLMPMKPALALLQVGRPPGAAGSPQWIPLSVALPWAEAHPDTPADRTGPELLHEFFDHLTGKKTAAIANATGMLAG